MIENVKDWLRVRAGKVMIIATGLFLALAVFSLVSALSSDGGSAQADAQAQEMVTDLEKDLATAKDDLAAKHSELLAGLPGMDIERVARDQATGRTLLLSLTDSSGSGETVLAAQQRLDARYTFLDEKSRTLTEFVPEWMAATGAGQGAGTTYMASELDVNVSSVQGLDYTYTGLARMDPVSADGEASSTKSEFVIFTFSTKADGTVTSLESYRASSSTRDRFLAAEEPDESASASPSDGS